MFVEFSTTKNESILVNLDKIFFLGVTKKGTVLVLDDGTLFDLNDDYAVAKDKICQEIG